MKECVSVFRFVFSCLINQTPSNRKEQISETVGILKRVFFFNLDLN